MANQSIATEIIDLEGDDHDFVLISPLSDGGRNKRDAISVEQYFDDRDLHLGILASLATFKPDNSNLIDLSDDSIQYSAGDDDLSILYFSRNVKKPRNSEIGESSNLRSKPDPNFVCEICVEPKPRNESLRIKGCSHSYCNDCISKYVAAKLQDNILTVHCPVTGCVGALEPEYCRSIIPKEVFDRWGDALCEEAILASKRYYCPYEDCSAMLVMDDGDLAVIMESECPYCHRLFCARCRVKWHSGIGCEEYQRLGEDERGREDIMLINLAQSKKWRRCPACKIYVEKSDGCLYMKCRCGFAFCYNCGFPSKDHSHFCYNCKR